MDNGHLCINWGRLLRSWHLSTCSLSQDLVARGSGIGREKLHTTNPTHSVFLHLTASGYSKDQKIACAGFLVGRRAQRTRQIPAMAVSRGPGSLKGPDSCFLGGPALQGWPRRNPGTWRAQTVYGGCANFSAGTRFQKVLP